MSFTCKLSRDAAKQLKKLPRKCQEQIALAIDALSEDPVGGDVRPIKAGKFRGALRKRVGRYRIIFSLDPSGRSVEIAAILVRHDKTYR